MKKTRLIDEKECGRIIVDAISAAAMVGGQRLASQDIAAMAKILRGYIAEKLPSLTAEKFRGVMKDGAVGRYGDYFVLSVKTIFGWLTAEAGTVINAQQEEEPVPALRRIPHDPDKKRLAFLQFLYDQWRMQLPYFYNDWPGLANWIVVKGVSLVKDAEGTEARIREEMLDRRSAEPSLRRMIDAELAGLHGSGELRRRIAKDAVLRFFADCEEMGTTPKEVIETKMSAG